VKRKAGWWLALATVGGIVTAGLSIKALSLEHYTRVCGHHGGPILLVAGAVCLAMISLFAARKFAGEWGGGTIVIPAVAVIMASIALTQLPGSPHGCGR
jgi:hypothetical protein